MRGLRLGLGFQRGRSGPVAPYSISIGSGEVITGSLLTANITGLLGGEVITYQWQDDGVSIAGRTSSTYTVAIGTDSVADASLIRVVVTINGVPYTSNSRQVRFAAGSFGALTSQSFADDTGNQTYVFPAATGAGLTWTYALTAPPAGVTINSGTRTITFDTNALALQVGTMITVTAVDQYGRAATGSPRSFLLDIVVGTQATAVDLQAQPSAGADVPVQITGTVGLYHWILTLSNPAVNLPTRAQVVAGQTHTGAAAPAFGSYTTVANPGTVAADLPDGLNGLYYKVLADSDSVIFDPVPQNINTLVATWSTTGGNGVINIISQPPTPAAPVTSGGNGTITITG